VVPTTPSEREPGTADPAVQVRLPIHHPADFLKFTAGCVIFIGTVLLGAAALLLWARSEDPVVYWVAPVLGLLALACFCIKPILRRQFRLNGAMVTARVEFGPDGFRQPLEDKTTLVLAWDDVRRFVFREGQAHDRVALAVSLADEAAVRNLAPDCRHESEDGFILSSAMAREEAQKAAAAIAGYRPGLVRWTRKGVRRGGFGVPRPVKRLIKRWREDKAPAVREIVRADRSTAGRRLCLWGGWVIVTADFGAPAFFDIPAGIPLPVAVVIWVLLYRTRYRGEEGEFALTADAITWRPKEGQPVVVPRRDLVRMVVEPSAKIATRRYVALHVIFGDGGERVVATKISPGSAALVMRDFEVEATP